MSKTQEALTLALEALESLFNWKVDYQRAQRCQDAITAIREALAEQDEYGGEFIELAEQPARKPVFIMGEYVGNGCVQSVSFGIPQGVWKQPAQQQEPVSLTETDAEFLSVRLGRVAKLAGVQMPTKSHQQIAELAGVILGDIARKLEAQQQEPVASKWLAEMIMSDCGFSTEYTPLLDRIIGRIEAYDRANTSPASKPWVGLTDEEREELDAEAWHFGPEAQYVMRVSEMTEAKLRAKNCGTGEA